MDFVFAQKTGQRPRPAQGELADVDPRRITAVYPRGWGDAHFYRSLVQVGIILFTVAALFTSSRPASAQEFNQKVLWLVDEDSSGAGEAVLQAAAQALADQSKNHLFGPRQLRQHVQELRPTLPDCAFGAEPCPDAHGMVFEVLDLGLLVRLELRGQADRLEMSYEMVDRRGMAARVGRIRGASAREVGFELVRELFDAVGVVSFESAPAGATIFVDGRELGRAPLSHQFDVGTYDIRLKLQGHDEFRGPLEVRSGGVQKVSASLVERPGRLRVSGAPAEAIILLNGEEWGRAEEIQEVAAGDYTLEVRAEGYEPYQQRLEILAEEVTDIEVDLKEEHLLLREMEPDAIAAHRFQLSLGVELGVQMATFYGASGSSDGGDEYQFEGWLDGGELGEQGRQRALMVPLGLRAAMGWEGRWVGLTFLALSFSGQNSGQMARLRLRGSQETADATISSVRRLGLRPMQLRLRFFYKNLAPYLEAGVGVALHTMKVALDGEEPFSMRKAQAFANGELGLRYHLDPRWSVGVNYQLQHHFDSDLGAVHSLGVSFGMGLRSLPWLKDQPPEEL